MSRSDCGPKVGDVLNLNKTNPDNADQKCTPCVGEAPALHKEQTRSVPYMAGKLLLNSEGMTDCIFCMEQIRSDLVRTGEFDIIFLENSYYPFSQGSLKSYKLYLIFNSNYVILCI